MTFLRPKDPEAWRELGTAQLRWADAAGGLDARRAAAAAFAEQVALAPEDGLGVVQPGLGAPPARDGACRSPATRPRSRSGSRRCAPATARPSTRARSARSDAARVHHNLGLVIDLLPSGAAARRPARPTRPPLDADPTYAQGALALVAARVAERDAARGREGARPRARGRRRRGEGRARRGGPLDLGGRRGRRGRPARGSGRARRRRATSRSACCGASS